MCWCRTSRFHSESVGGGGRIHPRSSVVLGVGASERDLKTMLNRIIEFDIRHIMKNYKEIEMRSCVYLIFCFIFRVLLTK